MLPLQAIPPTAVDRQIYSVHATDTHENAEAALKAATSGSLVLLKLTLPSSSHFDKDVVKEENLQNWVVVKSVKLASSVKS